MERMDFDGSVENPPTYQEGRQSRRPGKGGGGWDEGGGTCTRSLLMASVSSVT